MTHSKETRLEAIRLRTDERMSLREICRALPVSKATLSGWLRPYPLTDSEVAERRSRTRPRKEKEGVKESETYKVAVQAGMADFTTLQKSRISESAVLFRLALNGWSPYASMFDGEKYDWVVDIGQRLVKLQVKTARRRGKNSPTVSLRCADGNCSRSRRYQRGEFDYLVGYDIVTDTAYVWSEDEVSHLSSAVTVTENAREAWSKLNMLP